MFVGKERLRVLHEYFNQDTMEPFRFSFKELSESGKSVKDYIAPPGFDFRYPSRFKSGKMLFPFAACLFNISVYSSRISSNSSPCRGMSSWSISVCSLTDTAQKTITFKKMYRDGICQVASGYYTKMVEFFDINYDLLEIEFVIPGKGAF